MKVCNYIFIFFIILFSHSIAHSKSSINDIDFNNCENVKYEDKELNLIDLVHIGVCNNPALKSEYMSVKISEKNLSQGKSSYLPTIGASVYANKTWRKEENGEKESNNPYSGSLNLSWLIYDFGSRNAKINELKENINISKYAYNVELHDMVLSVSKAYLNLLSAKESLKSELENEKMYAKSYEESKKKYELGMISLSDELQAKTSYENSSLAVIKARNNVEQYKGNLAILLNLSPNTDFKLANISIDSEMITLQSNDVNNLMELALENRSEIKKLESQVELNKYDIKLAKNEFAPTITATASASYSNSWKKSDSYEKDSSIGINLSIPLFDGFSSVNSIKKAKHTQQQTKYSLDNTKNEIKNEVWTAYQDYKTAVDTYAKSKQVLKSSEENYKVAFTSYEVGKIDIVSLLTASSQLAQARQERINAFYSVLINKVILYRTIGEF